MLQLVRALLYTTDNRLFLVFVRFFDIGVLIKFVFSFVVMVVSLWAMVVEMAARLMNIVFGFRVVKVLLGLA